MELEPLGISLFILSLGVVATKRFMHNERDLFALQDEMTTAREMQTSILPRSVPVLQRVEVEVRYIPMKAVAGDFYDFHAS